MLFASTANFHCKKPLNFSYYFELQSLLSPQSRLVVASTEDASDSVISPDAISIEVPVDEVRAGDSVLVLPGETIPVDVCIMFIWTCLLFFFLFS